ncbi:hypothetical protein [Roseateles depolymerans]|uniref:Uncharacterized protein n=1 Tax=Roseateles depolymerans TaxID=76731 RepID=A0A0U3N0Q5_9BURK|nr:hypothetical protein [Roseateles depolymerans]ALV05803.1 hypothetical protein RD2015_1312 [Roseateles depolymerans]REG12925.1 hypothetical protein DES44_4297 [Roseateles depolymerans]
MFPSPSVSFLAAVPKLFTPDSFKDPKRLMPQRPREDWVSFQPLDSAGRGNFASFRNSPQFLAVQQQFLERIEQCKAFAEKHFTLQEADVVLTGLDTFAERLTRADGVQHFGDSLEPLYGLGKRHFDSFCTRLAQDSADLEDRKTALRELASELRACGNVCPALHEAALRLNSDPAGLRGEFHEVLVARIDALLQETISHPPTDAPVPLRSRAAWAEWLRAHEKHVIQRLKLELGLPVGPVDGALSTRTDLITGELLTSAHSVLRHRLHPVALAGDLAERYMTRLREATHPGQSLTRRDLSLMMPFIRQEHARVNATYGPIPLEHLVREDAQTRHIFWQEDLSLLTRDLLTVLAQKGLIVEQPNKPLQMGYDDDASWEISHINWQLFIVKEQRQGHSTRQAVPPKVAHVLSMQKHGRGDAPPSALTESVIRANLPRDLMSLPPHWLTDTGLCTTFCRSMDDDSMRDWIARHRPIGQERVRLLLPVLTRAGMHKALTQLMQSPEGARAHDWFHWGGGPALLARVVGVERTMGRLMRTDASPDVERVWVGKIEDALPALSEVETKQLFTLGERGLVEEVAKVGRVSSLTHVLWLLRVAATFGRVSGKTLQTLVTIPMQPLMGECKVDMLEAHADAVMEMVQRGLLPANSLPVLMEGALAPGYGCRGALESGQFETVNWFHRRVRLHHSHGHLTDEQAAALVRSVPQDCDSGAVMALRNGHAQALYEQMGQLQYAVSTGMLAKEEMPDLLAFRDMEGMPGFEIMLTEPKAGACLDRWTLSLKEATFRTHLTPEELLTLLAAYDAAGQPLLARLIAGKDGLARAKAWLQTIGALSGSLPPGGVVRLLEATANPAQAPRSLLFSTMKEQGDTSAITSLIHLYGVAHQQKLLSDDELARLLVLREVGGEAVAKRLLASRKGPNGKPGPATPLHAYLLGVLELGQQGRLQGLPVLKLLHALARYRLTPMAAHRAEAFRTVLEGLLDTSLSSTSDGRIHANWWGYQLMEADVGVGMGVRAALGRHPTEALLLILEPLMKQAKTEKLHHGPVDAQLQQAWIHVSGSAPTWATPPTPRPRGTPPSAYPRPHAVARPTPASGELPPPVPHRLPPRTAPRRP